MEAQPSTKSMLPKTILVGLDGSAGSARALDWATAMAKALDAEIVAVHVVRRCRPARWGSGWRRLNSRTIGWTIYGGALKTSGRLPFGRPARSILI
jgi:hypothetical protein